MIKHLAFALVALSFATTQARAEEAEHRKLYEFNFACEFDKSAPFDASTLEQDTSGSGCYAFAKVYAYVNPHDWMNTMEAAERGGVSNKLAVICHNELVYANGAFLDTSSHKFVSIKGLEGLPALLVKRKHSESVTTPSSVYDALLVLWHGKKLHGQCKVRNEPVHGRADAELGESSPN